MVELREQVIAELEKRKDSNETIILFNEIFELYEKGGASCIKENLLSKIKEIKIGISKLKREYGKSVSSKIKKKVKKEIK